MKRVVKSTEPDFLVVNQPLPEADRLKLSAIIANAKKTASKKRQKAA